MQKYFVKGKEVKQIYVIVAWPYKFKGDIYEKESQTFPHLVQQ